MGYKIVEVLHIIIVGRGTQINTCVNKLLLVFHDGVIWLGKPIPMNVDLIVNITGLPATRMDPTPLLKKD